MHKLMSEQVSLTDIAGRALLEVRVDGHAFFRFCTEAEAEAVRAALDGKPRAEMLLELEEVPEA